jgi:hypothetical protein
MSEAKYTAHYEGPSILGSIRNVKTDFLLFVVNGMQVCETAIRLQAERDGLKLEDLKCLLYITHEYWDLEMTMEAWPT